MRFSFIIMTMFEKLRVLKLEGKDTPFNDFSCLGKSSISICRKGRTITISLDFCELTPSSMELDLACECGVCVYACISVTGSL